MNKKNLLAVLALSLMISVGAFASETVTDPVNDKQAKQSETATKTAKDEYNIVEVAVGNENFSTLVAAVKTAGLVETLSGNGPFTVFAPTNAAFGKLPAGTVESLLKPESKKALTGILTYHVVAGKFMAADVVKAIKANGGKFTIKTVQGGNLVASIQGKDVILTDAKGNTSKVIITDVPASNGVIHAIDTVVMP